LRWPIRTNRTPGAGHRAVEQRLLPASASSSSGCSACRPRWPAATPDRVPLSLVMDLFAPNAMGRQLSRLRVERGLAAPRCSAPWRSWATFDSIQFRICSGRSRMLWLRPMKIPRDLPEHAMADGRTGPLQREDYDKILEMGWSAWFGQYVGGTWGRRQRPGKLWRKPVPAGRWST